MDADRPEQTPEEIERDGMRAGTKWAGPDASPEALAAAGLPPDFFKNMREGAGHNYALVRSGVAFCSDLTCPYGCIPRREAAAAYIEENPSFYCQDCADHKLSSPSWAYAVKHGLPHRPEWRSEPSE